MTTQVRTWEERGAEGETGEPTSWHVSINGKPVPGGYIERTESGYVTHYPHMASKTFETLEAAKRALELAPPVSRSGLNVGKPIKTVEESDLISTEEAGEMLGVSRYRVNAMVANGVLSGARRDGQTLVSRASVLARASRGKTAGEPVGRFAHQFICYYPEGELSSWTMGEVDTEDEDEVYAANELIEAIADSELPENAELLDYHAAMARCSRVRKGLEPGGTPSPVCLDELLVVRESMLLEVEQRAAEAEAAAAAGAAEASVGVASGEAAEGTSSALEGASGE